MEPTYPWPGTPVVKCRLRCNYCTLTFAKDFDTFDDVRSALWVSYFPMPVANVREVTRTTARNWWRHKFDKTEERRTKVLCPNCAHQRGARIISREPIFPIAEAPNV